MKPSITAITFLTIIFILAAIDWYIIVKQKKSLGLAIVAFVIMIQEYK